ACRQFKSNVCSIRSQTMVIAKDVSLVSPEMSEHSIRGAQRTEEGLRRFRCGRLLPPGDELRHPPNRSGALGSCAEFQRLELAVDPASGLFRILWQERSRIDSRSTWRHR